MTRVLYNLNLLVKLMVLHRQILLSPAIVAIAEAILKRISAEQVPSLHGVNDTVRNMQSFLYCRRRKSPPHTHTHTFSVSDVRTHRHAGPTCFSSLSEGLGTQSSHTTEDKVQGLARIEAGTLAVRNTNR